MKTLALVLLLVSTSTFAQNLTGFTKVLLPVYTAHGITGANGTSFRTFLDVVVDPDVPLQYYPAAAFGEPPSIGQIVHEEGFSFFEAVPLSSGRMLFIDGNQASHVTFGYTLRSTSALGTFEAELPVVRERDFLSGRSYIFGVPLLPIIEQPANAPARVTGYATRSRIRVYDADNTGTLAVHLRVFFGYSGDGMPSVLYERDVVANQRDFDDPSYPYYGELDLPNVCSPGHSTANPCLPFGDLGVQITPNTNARYWAFVSTTDNTTGQVRIHHPQ